MTQRPLRLKTNLAPAEAEYLTSLVSASPCLSGDQLMEGMTSRLENIPEDEIISLTKTAKTDLKSLWKAKRNPVILILDPEVQGLPWESLPLMRRCKQPVSRVPSLPLLHSLWPAWSTPAWPRTASSTSSTRTITSRTLRRYWRAL